MKPQSRTTDKRLGKTDAVPVMVARGDVRQMMAEVERVMEEVELQATMVGPVLEAILHEAGDQSSWED
jgi:hypothetical protein